MVWALVAGVLGGCSTHSVGRAPTTDDYERKARTTAEVALSAVETVRLVADTASAGDAFASYTNVSLSEQEDSLGAAQGDFESIQPPHASLDDLREQLIAILDNATAHVADVRIAARRGQLAGLDEVAAPLAADAEALRAFEDELS